MKSDFRKFTTHETPCRNFERTIHNNETPLSHFFELMHARPSSRGDSALVLAVQAAESTPALRPSRCA